MNGFAFDWAPRSDSCTGKEGLKAWQAFSGDQQERETGLGQLVG